MKAKYWSDIAAILVAAVLVAALVFVLRPQHTPTLAVDPSAARVDRLEIKDVKARSTMLFIGDSYVAGTGLDETSYGCMASVRMGWTCRVAAGPGTGYISGGPSNRFELDYLGESTSFNERIAGSALTYRPDIVMLDGGRNDLFAPAEDVYAAMLSTLGDLRRTWPTATIVLIRPRFLSRPDDDLGFDDAFFDRLKAEQDAQHMFVFVDPISRLAGEDTPSMVTADGIHPNREGELAMSNALVDSLLAIGFIQAS